MKREPETAVARRFAAALAQLDPVRVRIHIEAYTAAFLAVEPALVTSPERRSRLAGAIDDLIAAGVLTGSRTVDRSELPFLPRFVVLRDRVADEPVGAEAAAYPWRPELSWAAKLPLRRSEFEALRAIQRFLRDDAAGAPVVPTGERSLGLFGDEKRLDRLRRNRRLFAPGRLSLELLKARLHAPPFVYRMVGNGPVALVLENVATYHSVLSNLPLDSPIGMVVFGGGANFAASACYLAQLVGEGPAASIREIRYFGDLDRRGLEIPIIANAAAREARLPRVRPAIGLWAKLLRHGVRAPTVRLDSHVADRLTLWLPKTLRTDAQELLVGGHRLAQEAVGTKVLADDVAWASWAGLGPPGVDGPAEPTIEVRDRMSMVSPPTAGASQPTADQDPQALSMEKAQGDGAWIDVRHTKNWVINDPLLDWLERHGSAAGFVRDDDRAAYDPRTDFRRFVRHKAQAFHAAVIELLRARVQVVEIGQTYGSTSSDDAAHATIEALRTGTAIIAGAVLRDPGRRTFGTAALLVRSDILASWFPELLSWSDSATPSPGFAHTFHYRVVEIRYHTFDLASDGHVASSVDQLADAVRVYLLSEALGQVQGVTPPAGYLLGRTWRQGEHKGEGCLDRLARVDLDRWIEGRDRSLRRLAEDAVAWARRLVIHGARWQVLPEPSVPELYPHARNTDDDPWHLAKRDIAHQVAELTLLPGVTPAKRAAAHAAGFRSWRDETVSVQHLGVTSPIHAARTDAVLRANRARMPVLIPDRITTDDGWRVRAVVEFYVDFETVNDLDDDFASLPRIGGQTLIFQIGCGQMTAEGQWAFAQWTVDALTLAEEERIIAAWIQHMSAACASAGSSLDPVRVFHWSAAEPANLRNAYAAARARHVAGPSWPCLGWFDVLDRVIRAEPVAVTGAFNFGLKTFAKAMRAAGLISLDWPDGPTDGLGAMTAAWSAANDPQCAGTPLGARPLMAEVARYNEVDCRAMAAIIEWLRKNR